MCSMLLYPFFSQSALDSFKYCLAALLQGPCNIAYKCWFFSQFAWRKEHDENERSMNKNTCKRGTSSFKNTTLKWKCTNSYRISHYSGKKIILKGYSALSTPLYSVSRFFPLARLFLHHECSCRCHRQRCHCCYTHTNTHIHNLIYRFSVYCSVICILLLSSALDFCGMDIYYVWHYR